MSAKHTDRLAGLNEQSFVVAKGLQRLDDSIVAIPVARSPADASVHDQLGRILCNIRIQVVHQHAQRRLGQPAAGAQGRAARGSNNTGSDWG
jgi:hypothetical protein